MSKDRAASRYAEAIFGLAKEAKQLEQVDRELFRVRGILGQYPEVTHLVLNSTIAFSEKEDFLEKILGSGSNRLVLDFLKVLVRKKRFHEFREIQEIFHRLFEKSQGIREVTAISRSPLSADAEAKLTKFLEKKLTAKIRLLKETNPAIVGGLILRFDGMEIDASYKNRLSEIRQKLKA